MRNRLTLFLTGEAVVHPIRQHPQERSLAGLVYPTRRGSGENRCVRYLLSAWVWQGLPWRHNTHRLKLRRRPGIHFALILVRTNAKTLARVAPLVVRGPLIIQADRRCMRRTAIIIRSAIIPRNTMPYVTEPIGATETICAVRQTLTCLR